MSYKYLNTFFSITFFSLFVILSCNEKEIKPRNITKINKSNKIHVDYIKKPDINSKNINEIEAYYEGKKVKYFLKDLINVFGDYFIVDFQPEWEHHYMNGIFYFYVDTASYLMIGISIDTDNSEKKEYYKQFFKHTPKGVNFVNIDIFMDEKIKMLGYMDDFCENSVYELKKETFDKYFKSDKEAYIHFTNPIDSLIKVKSLPKNIIYDYYLDKKDSLLKKRIKKIIY